MCQKIVLVVIFIFCMETLAVIVRDEYSTRKRESVESTTSTEKSTDKKEDASSAEYEFSYSVFNDHTGDIKTHEESRKGDKVKGKYTLIDSDGFKRIVDYTANDDEGFIAKVQRERTYHKIPTHKNMVSQSMVASRAYNQVYYKSPLIHYTYSF